MGVYTADDREPGEFPTDTTASVSLSDQLRFEDVKGGEPDLAALQNLWAERDSQYATSPKYLTDDQIEAIRCLRLKEVNDLPVEQRGRAAMLVLAWYPPDHGQDQGRPSAAGLAGWRVR